MTEGTEGRGMRRLRSTSFVLLVALGVGLWMHACADDTAVPERGAPTDVASRDESADTDVRRTHVRQEPAEPEQAPAVELPEERHDEATAPRIVEEVSPPWQRVDLPRHEIEGRVVGPDGTPQEGVIVHAVSTWLDGAVYDALLATDAFSRHVVTTTESAADGTFRLTYVEGGDRRLVAGMLDRPDAVAPITPGRFHELVVPESDLLVTVRDWAGAPVAGASVYPFADLPWAQSPLKSQFLRPLGGKTGEDGVALLLGAPAGRIRLTVRTADASQAVHQVAIDSPAGRERAVVVTLPRLVEVRGRATDRSTGAPVEGAVAAVRGDVSRSNRSDRNGDFRMRLPLERNVGVTLEVHADGYATQTATAIVTEEPADTTVCEVRVRLDRFASLRLRCVDVVGVPVTDATVVVRTPYVAGETPITTVSEVVRAARTADDGVAVIDGLHPSDLDARVSVMRGGVVMLNRTEQPLSPGEVRDIGTLTVAAGRTLRGTVLDADGAPVSGALVLVRARAAGLDDDARLQELAIAALTRTGRRTATGQDGSFELRELPAGFCDVLVLSPPPGLLREGVVVTSGSDPPPLQLRLPRTVQVRGRVLLADGTPAAGATVLYRIPGPVQLDAVDTAACDADGRFTLPAIAEGAEPFDVTVVPPDDMDEPPEPVRPHIDPRGGDVTIRFE